MEQKLIVSPSPHVKGFQSTPNIMFEVIIALAPAGAFAALNFGFRVLLVIGACIFFAVLSEYICRKVMKRDNTCGDLSAVVTGLLLAYNLPPDIPLWMAALGSVIAIVVVKQFFGGLGQNFANPAITARIVLMVSFPVAMTTWTIPKLANLATSATPFQAMAQDGDLPTLYYMFIGVKSGCIGETSAMLLIVGGIYLVLMKVIEPTIPFTYIGTVAILTLIFGQNPLLHILSGGLILGAIFMATDYVTSPITRKGKIIFGIGCGVITTLIRLYSALPEGVSYSILLMNILVPHIENLTAPKPFGMGKERK